MIFLALFHDIHYVLEFFFISWKLLLYLSCDKVHKIILKQHNFTVDWYNKLFIIKVVSIFVCDIIFLFIPASHLSMGSCIWVLFHFSNHYMHSMKYLLVFLDYRFGIVTNLDVWILFPINNNLILWIQRKTLTSTFWVRHFSTTYHG